MAKNKIAFWGTIILILTMIIVIFVPMSIMRGTMADTVTHLNEKYEEDFTMAWSNIDDHPLSDSFTAVMKSNTTGITYDAIITEGEGVIADYESENENAIINTFVEQQMPNTFAFAKLDGEALRLHILSAQSLTEEQLQPVAAQLKTEFQVTAITLNTLHVTEEKYTSAAEHYTSYYQRSTLPAEAFDALNPTIQQFHF